MSVKFCRRTTFTIFYAAPVSARAVTSVTGVPADGIESGVMASETKYTSSRAKSAVALLLTFVAGSVDVIGYIALNHVFTAHISGDTTHLGFDIPSLQWSHAIFVGTVIAAFLAGSVVTRAVIEVASGIRLRRVASITLSAEAMILVAFTVVVSGSLASRSSLAFHQTQWWLAALAFAMGAQTATLTRIGPLTVHTTFVTGMVNKLAQLLAHISFETYHIYRGTSDRQTFAARRRKFGRDAMFITGIWLLYFAGAAVSTLLDHILAIRALYLSVFLLGCAIAIDCVTPLSLEEEKDQSER